MSGLKLAAIVLILAGIAGLAYGGFTYTKETHSADVGPLHLEVKEKERVNIPLWAGIAAIIGGVVVLALDRRA
jgi:multidrug transporter EmrE-like cation transporter